MRAHGRPRSPSFAHELLERRPGARRGACFWSFHLARYSASFSALPMLRNSSFSKRRRPSVFARARWECSTSGEVDLEDLARPWRHVGRGPSSRPRTRSPISISTEPEAQGQPLSDLHVLQHRPLLALRASRRLHFRSSRRLRRRHVRPRQRAVQQGGDVEDQGHPSVAQDRGARDRRAGPRKQRPERLDHGLALAQQVVDGEPGLGVRRASHDHDVLARRACAPSTPNSAAQAQVGQGLAAQVEVTPRPSPSADASSRAARRTRPPRPGG